MSETATKTPLRTILITGGDTKVMPVLQGLIRSLESFPERSTVSIGCLDVGQTEADRQWLTDHDISVVSPRSHMGIPLDRLRPYELAVLARPFLPSYFPGFDIYIWIDSDIWLQGWWVIDAYRQGAIDTGFAISHERERAYHFQGWLFGWFAKHMMQGYGPFDAAWLLSRPHLNAGLFAMRADSPHWNQWAELYKRAYDRTGKLTPHDQFSLNRLAYGGMFEKPKLQATILPPRYNWICDRGPPMWSDEANALCEPYAPFRPIGTVHLAGPGKTTRYTIRRTGGGSFEALLLQGLKPPATTGDAA